jgi:hypothetical protein
VALGQTPPRSINPEAIEFDVSTSGLTELTQYRVELFTASADTQHDPPIKSIDLPRDSVNDGRVRVPVKAALSDVPDGQYVATIRTENERESIQSEPSPTFIVSRTAAEPGEIDFDPRERFWTKVGLAIAAAILLVPLLLK